MVAGLRLGRSLRWSGGLLLLGLWLWCLFAVLVEGAAGPPGSSTTHAKTPKASPHLASGRVLSRLRCLVRFRRLRSCRSSPTRWAAPGGPPARRAGSLRLRRPCRSGGPIGHGAARIASTTRHSTVSRSSTVKKGPRSTRNQHHGNAPCLAFELAFEFSGSAAFFLERPWNWQSSECIRGFLGM